MTEQSHHLARYLNDGMIKQAIKQSRVTELPRNDDRMARLLETLSTAERSDNQRPT
jgi:hypothetical protein